MAAPNATTPAPRLNRDAARDQIDAGLEAVKKFAEILYPGDVDEPILAPRVAHAIHEWLVEIHNATDLAAVKVEPRRLALLYGPPGTGKTTLAHHLAARLGVPLVAVQAERLTESYMSGTGKNIGALFDALKDIEKHCVLLLDEFDAIGQKRQAASGRNAAIQHDNNQALTILLRRIEHYRGVGLAATNTKDEIDPAMWRRFGLQISVDLPGEHERFAIIRKYALPFDLEDAAIDVLVTSTRGCSPSLLRQLMEGMKRTLILGPKLRIDVSRPETVFEQVISSIAPPPEMQQPPLWAATSNMLHELADVTWPPTRTQG
jgi:SpoVK/Ycf46/Vps4 family AAA+-type ATPase